MITSTINEAQSDLAKLIGLAEKGEEVVIAQEGKPVARIVPYDQTDESSKGGQWEGRVHHAPIFDELPSNIGNGFMVTMQ